MATDYMPVNIPSPLLEEVDKVVSDQSKGYRSRNEFCVDAVRRFLANFRNNNYPSKKV